MKLERLENLCFFVSPARLPVKSGGSFSVAFSGNGHLVLNKKHTLSLHEGAFRIPFSLLKEGENTLSLSTPEGALLCEGITLKDGNVFPSGIQKEDYMPLVFKEIRRLKQAFKAQAEELCALKEKLNKRTLFS